MIEIIYWIILDSKSFRKSLFIESDKKIVERPQHMWLRAAIGIHGKDLEKLKKHMII